MCEIEEDPKAVKVWLSNTSHHWLLIIDNADDRLIDIAEFFPTCHRGSILITTRNPDCKIYSTVGWCELGGMDFEEALALFLRASGVEDISAEIARKAATPVVEVLGCLALAIAQAGAYVRKGLYSMDEY
jgi:hypothetical protein